jgi:CRISPR-associated endonuclease/helicase Cas3
MSNLTADDFEAFFRALQQYRPGSHAGDGEPAEPSGFDEQRPTYGPFPWQQRLLETVLDEGWPGCLDLPTGSGKTASLDIAVFALAMQASRDEEADISQPRRIVFCVNRRVIVDEAYERAYRLAAALWHAEQHAGPAILQRVAENLRRVAGTKANEASPPLDALALRGGIYRDDRWARSATQPTILTTTVDQLGSRLLFRGYGVSNSAKPIQAALLAYDALVLLDEAHISEPFLQTLQAVRRFADANNNHWGQQRIGPKPFELVPMSATLAEYGEPLALNDADRRNPVLQARLGAEKLARLEAVSSKKLVDTLTDEARRLAEDDTPRAVGVIANRIQTAKAVYDKLCATLGSEQVELVIGPMRPVDREDQLTRLQKYVGSNRPDQLSEPRVVVATQTLEVGADFDFDALVTECASLDALRQRFGRLNRRGRDIQAEAVIVADEKQLKPEYKLDPDKPIDPIYGNALPRTWHWLSELSEQRTDGQIDFGIEAMDQALTETFGTTSPPLKLSAPSARAEAPTLLPAHLDMWAQTAPRPQPDPDVGLFLHGPQRSAPEVQVCWRADLPPLNNNGQWSHVQANQAIDTVSLLPPSVGECLSVPIGRVKHWLRKNELPADANDQLGSVDGSDQPDSSSAWRCNGVVWRGRSAGDEGRGSVPLRCATDVQPGDTLVLPEQADGWNALGHIPPTAVATPQATDQTDQATADSEGERNASTAASIDVAERAFYRSHGKAALRLHPNVLSAIGLLEALDPLRLEWADPETNEPTVKRARDWLQSVYDQHKALPQTQADRVKRLCDTTAGLRIEEYPSRSGEPPSGYVLFNQRRSKHPHTLPTPDVNDDGDDELTRAETDQAVTLQQHTETVIARLNQNLEVLGLEIDRQTLTEAGRLHDIGKADERFQAMLMQGDRTFICADAQCLAKSRYFPLSRHAFDRIRQRAELPLGFRHEMLSMQLAEQQNGHTEPPHERELLLHLIASHHGRARPFAPVVEDPDPPAVECNGFELSAEQRHQRPPHRLDSGIADRFWRLNRRFNWWGLAYLEAVLRLADQQASQEL